MRVLTKIALTAALVFTAASCATAQPEMPERDYVTRTSPHGVEETARRLADAVEAKGATVFAVVDHAENARSADMTLPPTTLVIFGNPKIGTPFMTSSRRAGLDLPVRVLVFEKDDVTQLTYLAPAALAARHGVTNRAEAVAAMTKALDGLTGAAIAAD